MLIRDAEVSGRVVDVLVRDGVVSGIGAGLPRDDEEVDAGGGALLPGLHDHHLHLLATAAAMASVDLSVVDGADGMAAALRATATDGWLRAVGYDESLAGDLDRDRLDALRADVPVRMQHRSGALWVVNSAAVAVLGLDDQETLPAGVERDDTGRCTGRLWREDTWLRERLDARGVADALPDLKALGRRLAGYGITGVTDATPDLDAAAVRFVTAGTMPQRVTLLARHAPASCAGPRKIVVPDHALPGLDELAADVRASHDAGRPVAVHCVTRAALLLTLAVLDEVGAVPGDRIEHAAVASPEEARRIAALGVRVVTQPSLPHLRGDDYLDRSDDHDRAWLWPYRTLLDSAVPVACSSDAPYGDLDPWTAMRFAVDRRTRHGAIIGRSERVDAGTALAGYLGSAADPGGRPRRVAVGATADLVLLHRPLDAVLDEPDASQVRATWIAGRPVAGDAP